MEHQYGYIDGLVLTVLHILAFLQHVKLEYIYITFTFIHLADAFIQSDVQ